MLIVQDCIISEDIADQCFCCDLAQCKGQCCVEGDCGAPLLEEEIPILERILHTVEPYMTEAGIEVVHRDGVSALDNAAEPCTPLVNNRECDGKIDWPKPISCHLYPLRIDEYGEFKSVNYHRWDVCRCAVAKGKECGVPLYQYLREPLIHRFGKEWYEELCTQCAQYPSKQQ